MDQDALPQRASRDATRSSMRSKRSRSRSRSASASSRSRSRSRERALRPSRRSRSTSRTRHSSRHSRSTSRDRGSRRVRGRHRQQSSRHRDRSRSRGRHSYRTRSNNRKRSRRERSRSTEGRRHHRRDSSPRDGDGHDRRQRRRRGSNVAAAESVTAVTTTATSAVPSTSIAVSAGAELPKKTENTPVTQQANGEAMHEIMATQEDTPTSQDSAATSAATTTASSQSDVEIACKPVTATKQTAVGEHTGPSVTVAETLKKPQATAAKVDVKSIKMDILKALADARSTIAGIKGAVPTAPGAPTTVPGHASPPQASTPETGVVAAPERNDQGVCSSAFETKPKPQPVPADALKSISPQQQQVSSVDVDEFDMFSASELHGASLPLSPAAAPASLVVGAAVQSNFDDADGYYKPNIGEILNSKYRVMGTVGKGVFSTVLRCQRLASTVGDDPELVAIKLIRNNEIMREASQTEIKILTHLSERDPREKKHCVRLLERFEHRNHVALVFESMQMNVREAMKKFGGKGGISIQAVRIFCKHLLIALTHLEACGIVHADIKPDNVLLDEKQTMVKLCDFGSAFESKEGKHDPTPYLVSRFYRAPEIVLGLPYDKAVDMWSVGCCLYEMFTGKVMFPGATNNEMLKLFMELKGKVPNKIIKKHRQAYIEQFQMEPHFTEDNKFCSHELDRVTGKPVLRLMDAMKTRFDLGNALHSAKSSTDERKQVLELKNLLERMFTLDAAKRITPKEALAHPFVKTEGKQAA